MSMKFKFPNPFKKSKPATSGTQLKPETSDWLSGLDVVDSKKWIDKFNKLMEEGDLLRVTSMISSKMIPETIWNTPENIKRVSDILLSNIKNNEQFDLEDIARVTAIFNIPKEILTSEEVIRWAILLIRDKINKVVESNSRPITISKTRNSLSATYAGLEAHLSKETESAIELLIKVKKLFSLSNETFEMIGDKILQKHSVDEAKMIEYWVKSMIEEINQKEN